MGLDSELSWHLLEILERLAVFGGIGGRSGKLAERLFRLKKEGGHLLPPVLFVNLHLFCFGAGEALYDVCAHSGTCTFTSTAQEAVARAPLCIPA